MNIQIPKTIIKDPRLGANDFLMIVWLKRWMFLWGEVMKVSVSEIKGKMNVADTRTIKKIFEKLNKFEIVEWFQIRKFYVELKINKDKMNEQPYAQLPVKVLEKAKVIGSAGVRLLYYYECHINRDEKKDFCYASVRTIVKETGLADKTIKAYNNVLEKEKLLKVVRHGFEEEYDEMDEVTVNRYNNHYYVLVDNI